MRKEIPVKEASNNDLRQYAEEKGINVHPGAKRDQLLTKLNLNDEMSISIGAGDLPKENDAPDYVIVRIATSESEGGDKPVVLGFNTKLMLVERGAWSLIPWGYYNSLKDAVEDRYDPLPGGGVGAPRQVPRFPHELWDRTDPPADLKTPPAFSGNVDEILAKRRVKRAA